MEVLMVKRGLRLSWLPLTTIALKQCYPDFWLVSMNGGIL